MVCASCGEGPKKCSCHGRDFPSAVVEINNPEQLVLLRKVVVPATLPEADNPPTIGKYRNVILKYEDTGNIYIYSSDGIPTAIEANVPQEIWERITELEDDLEAEELHRMSADDVLQSNINTVSGNLTILTGRVTTAEGDIDAIEGKIPNQATAQNQLADKDFVNSSIATNTANFIGTFNSVAELEAYTGEVTNNDYAFVIVTDAQGNTAYDRYKYNGDTEDWLFEYELNNSSFTAAQWAAINSGITSGNVTKLSGLADIKTIGSNLSLDANGQLSGNYTHFTGATSSTDGTQGLVPAPLAGDEDKFLKADGTWGAAGSAVNVVQTTGTSTTDVMSQNAVTSMVFADPATQYKIKIGAGTSTSEGTDSVEIGRNAAATKVNSTAVGVGASATGSRATAIGQAALVQSDDSVALGGAAVRKGSNNGVAIGYAAGVDYNKRGAIALGAYSSATAAGEMNIGSSNTSSGYNNSNYRLLSGLYDPQSAHDAATKGYVDTATANAPTITMSATDPGEGSTLAENHFVGVYGGDPIIMDYSTDEINTGAKWIDGTPIYKKTINFGALPNAGDKSVAHGISGLNRVVLMTGYTYQPTSGRTRPLPPMTKSYNDLMDIYTEGANVTIRTNNDWSPYTETYINLYYTKSS